MSYLPFFLGVNGHGAKVNTIRVVELLIMAAAVGGITYAQMQSLREDVREIKQTQKEYRTEVRAEFSELRVEFREVKRDMRRPDGSRDSWGTRKEPR
jgi:hypothetical protein